MEKPFAGQRRVRLIQKCNLLERRAGSDKQFIFCYSEALNHYQPQASQGTQPPTPDEAVPLSSQQMQKCTGLRHMAPGAGCVPPAGRMLESYRTSESDLIRK